MATTAPAAIGSGPVGSLRLTFEIEGFERVDVAISRLQRDVTDFREFWTDYAAPKFFRDVQRNFELEGGRLPSGGPWKALSTTYAAWKAKHFPGKTILRRTDRLYESLSGPGAAENITRAERDHAEFGTSVPYAELHQKGKGKLPQRRVLFLPAGTSSAYGRLLHAFVADQAQRAGFGLDGGGRAALSVSRFD